MTQQSNNHRTTKSQITVITYWSVINGNIFKHCVNRLNVCSSIPTVLKCTRSGVLYNISWIYIYIYMRFTRHTILTHHTICMSASDHRDNDFALQIPMNIQSNTKKQLTTIGKRISCSSRKRLCSV